MTTVNRRDCLRLAGAASLGLLLPEVFRHGLAAADGPKAALATLDWSRTLILVELRGGNDGLNTVVPFGDPLYYKARPTIGVPPDQVLKLTTGAGLHPKLQPLMPAWSDGDLGIVLGVGYANPNRSHFRGIDIWNGGTKADELARDGWIARVLAQAKTSQPSDVLADGIVLGYHDTVGHGGFGPLYGDGLRNLIMNTPDEYVRRARGVGKAAGSGATSALRHVLSVQDDIATTADRIAELQKKAPALKSTFPAGNLGQHLQVAAKLIAAGATVPVWKVTLDGFDTHAGQKYRHEQLLGQLGEALAGFRAAMIEARCWDRCLVMTYSEFGRRVEENGSAGTDHGTAAPHFVMGGRVKGGFHGRQPRLDQLDGGDLVYTTDFRTLYMSVAQEWWGFRQPFLSERRAQPLGLIKA